MNKIPFLLFFLALFFSCDKNNIGVDQIHNIESITFNHSVDRLPLVIGPDTCCLDGSLLPYTNNIQQNYNIQTLKYFISNINLHTHDSIYHIKDIHFVDVNDSATLKILIGDLNYLNFTSVSFTFGLDDNLNINESYLNESWHSTMFWPITMGGGYHNMKLEGDFDTITKGYTTHLGPSMGMDHSFNKSFLLDLVRNRESTLSLNINMNINNWYTSPNDYLLTNEGIMGDMGAQMTLRDNGLNDVFSISLE